MKNNLKENLILLNTLAEQCENESDLEHSIDIFEQSVSVAEQCLAQLQQCKGKLVVLSDKVKEIIGE